MTENEIINGLKDNDESAIMTLINMYGDAMLRTSLAISGDLQIAEEIVQDTFLKVCQKIHTFQNHSSLKTWIMRICINKAKNRSRNKWVNRIIPLPTEYNEIAAAKTEDNPEQWLIKNENSDEILKILQQLPIKYREIIILYYLENMTIKEISSLLQQSPGTIKSKLHRGRTMLKAKLLDMGWCAND